MFEQEDNHILYFNADLTKVLRSIQFTIIGLNAHSTLRIHA